MDWRTNDDQAGRAFRSGKATHSGSRQSPGRSASSDRGFTPLRRSVLLLAGATVMVFGCQQDRADRVSEDVRPSAVGRQTDDTSPSGGTSGTLGAQDEGAAQGQAGGEGDNVEGDEGDETLGGTSGGGTSGTGTSGTGTSGTGTSGGGATGSGSGG